MMNLIFLIKTKKPKTKVATMYPAKLLEKLSRATSYKSSLLYFSKYCLIVPDFNAPKFPLF